MKVVIVTEYEDMSRKHHIWANEEEKIDWRRDFFEGTRCTISYAAEELKTFLGGILNHANIVYSTIADGDVNIYLQACQIEGRTSDYELLPCEKGVKIIGETRVGVLYGVYEFLKLQGYRWFSPDGSGTHKPPKTDKLILPEVAQKFVPALKDFRGFDMFFVNPGQAFHKWMARNRLNGARPHPGSVALQNKLGMVFKSGGHFLDKFMSPNSILEDGTRLWDSKKEWFGVRKDGTEVTPANAKKTQFCVSNMEMCKHIANEIINRLKTVWFEPGRNDMWTDTEMVDIWGYDTWGDTCDCEKCRAIGNGSDQTLHLLSVIRDEINKHEWNRKIRIGTCVYGGTCTLEPPTKPIPQNLIEAGDYIIVYPITRCYRHGLDDESCAENLMYHRSLEGWLNMKPAMPVVMGEYYNVPKAEVFPLVLKDIMCHDIPNWINMGVSGITYMHVPIYNWGTRALINWVYANLSFDPTLDKDALIDDYFNNLYHENAEVMRNVYSKLEEALADINLWRSWSPESVLSQLGVWNGAVPKKPLLTQGHYENQDELLEKGQYYVSLMQEAKSLILDAQEVYLTNLPDVEEIPLARNPNEVNALRKVSGEDFKLAEIVRQINCGMDSMSLIVSVTSYYVALYKGLDTTEIWKEVEHLYRKVEGYYTCPEYYTTGGMVASGLERTELQSVIRRCASYRKNHPEIA